MNVSPPQADCLKHRKEIIQVLKPQEFEQLWTAYLTGNQDYHTCICVIFCFDCCGTENYDNFWAINNKLMANARGDLDPFKHIPFVIYEVSDSMWVHTRVGTCACVCSVVCN